MATNFKYTNVTYEDIVKEITDRLNVDPRFDNYRESSIVQQLIEIFAGAVDITNYYLQRRAEECFFDTAQLRSSVILLSRQLGYVVQRPIPASAKLKIKLKGNFSGVNVGSKIQLPFHSIFTYEGFNLILKRTLAITITTDMYNLMISQGDSYESDFITVDDDNADIDIIQGEIKEKVIEGLNNPQVSQKFQLYKIEDTEFSNIYGEEDYTPQTTRVWVGNTKDREYVIDRRSLVNWQRFNATNASTSDNKLCVIRSAITEDVELMFGDARYTALGATVSANGPQTTYDNIYIQYLATKGSKGNQTGVIGKKLNFGDQIYVEGTTGSIDITNKVEFYFKNNLIGGADMEDIDSIRVNAPNIYYALDRLVTSKDYQSFLKTLSSPIIIRNAIAWGEQEECLKKTPPVTAIKELFNIVFYTCIGDMYQVTQSPYYARTKNNGLDSTVLDNNFDENEIAERNYYNVYTYQNVVKQLKEYETSSYYYQIIGNNIEQSTTLVSTLNSYDNIDIMVLYNSEDFNSLGNTTINISLLAGSLQPIDYYTVIANSLQSKLRSIIDDRPSTPTGGNAFSNATVTYDSVDSKFIISTDQTIDNCYIQQLSANDLTVLGLLGISGSSQINYGSLTVNLSNKIIDVNNILKERSMITIQNIYISPIIQNFDIKGKVYINTLTDKEILKVNIANAIYSWLNINADFNIQIYKSNIIDIINSFNEVKYANIYFEPETLTPINTTTFYNNGNNKYTNVLPANYKMIVQMIISSELSIFISKGTTSDPKENNLNIIAGQTTVQQYNYQWNSYINERNFFSDFVKKVYHDLTTGNPVEVVNWANSNYFIKEMSLIHKDLLKIIRYNMMDTAGNIAQEYDSNNNYIKGGYSLGNEIVKMNVQLEYEYKK